MSRRDEKELRALMGDASLDAAAVGGSAGDALEAAELRYYDLGEYDRRRRRIRGRITLIVVVALVLVLGSVVGLQWWEQVRDPSIESYATEQVVITGLGEQFTVTPQDLLEMDCVWESATGKSSQSTGGTSVVKTAEVYGPTLETFLAYYGYEMSDFTKIKIVCKDDYYVILRPQKEQVEVILSIANGKSALLEQQQPLRLVIPSAESSRWAYGVCEIQFTRNKNSSSDGAATGDLSDLPSVLQGSGK